MVRCACMFNSFACWVILHSIFVTCRFLFYLLNFFLKNLSAGQSFPDQAHHPQKIIYTVELWSLELACLEHQGSLELVPRPRQFPHTFNVKIHHRLEQRWLELSNSKPVRRAIFSCKNAMISRTKYFFT